jgi:small subunit ribosomal protein S1
MSWTKRIKHPSKIVNIGDKVEAVVLDIDQKNKRISLGMKQAIPNPWSLLEQKYPIGTVIKSHIRNLTDFGIFICVEDGIDGLIHISDLSWTHRVKHPSEIYQKNDEIEAVVLNIDVDNERFSLGIKQLHEDPWGRIPSIYPRGTKITGIIRKITDFGAFIEIEPGIDGLCHISEFSAEHIKDPRSFIKLNQKIDAVIIDIDKENRKISLSIKAAKKYEKDFDYKSYLSKQNKQISNTKTTGLGTLGEAFKDKLTPMKDYNEKK